MKYCQLSELFDSHNRLFLPLRPPRDLRPPALLPERTNLDAFFPLLRLVLRALTLEVFDLLVIRPFLLLCVFVIVVFKTLPPLRPTVAAVATRRARLARQPKVRRRTSSVGQPLVGSRRRRSSLSSLVGSAVRPSGSDMPRPPRGCKRP